MSKTIKKNGRLWLIALLSVFIMLIAMPQTAHAENPTTDGNCGDNGDNLKWSYDTTTKTLTISGTGDMYDYSWEDGKRSPWYVFKDEMKKVIVKEGVTCVGNHAFYGHGNLSEAELPITLEGIGEYAFSEVGCYYDNSTLIVVGLTVTLPSNLKILGSSAFAGSAIKHVSIPKGIKKLERTFQNSLIETIDLGEVEEIGEYAFYSCSGITAVALPKTLKVIGAEAFCNTSITEIVIPEGVTTLGEPNEHGGMAVFEMCRDLKRIVLPSTLTFISANEFAMCDKLEEFAFRGTEEQWNQLMSGNRINPGSTLGEIINNSGIQKEYNYTKDLISIAGAKVDLSATTFTYNGSAQMPAVKAVTLGTETLKEGRDYTQYLLEKVSPENVGSYTVVVVGKGNYRGETSASYSINKATNTMSAKAKTVKIKFKKLKKKNQKVAAAKMITFTGAAQGGVSYKKLSVGSKKVNKKYGKKISINAKTGKLTVKKGLKKGTYKVKVQVKAAGDGNYNEASQMVTLKIIVK